MSRPKLANVIFYPHVEPSDALLDSWIIEPKRLQSIVALNTRYLAALERNITDCIVLLKSDLRSQKVRDLERNRLRDLRETRREDIRTQTQLKNTLKRIYRDSILNKP